MIAPQWRWWLWDGKLYRPERFTWAAWHRGLMTTGTARSPEAAVWQSAPRLPSRIVGAVRLTFHAYGSMNSPNPP